MTKQYSFRKLGIALAAALAGLSAGAMTTTAIAQDKKGQSWIKVCPQFKAGGPKICVTRTDYIDRVKSRLYAPIAIEEIEGKGKHIVATLPHVWLVPGKVKDKKTNKEKRVVAPLGATWNILSGMVVKIDKNKNHKLEYVYCNEFGCTAQAKATDALINEMKKGKNILVAGKNGAKTLGLPFTLQGFADAMKSKPIDEKKYLAAWQKRIANIRQQQMAALKKRREAAAAAQKK